MLNNHNTDLHALKKATASGKSFREMMDEFGIGNVVELKALLLKAMRLDAISIEPAEYTIFVSAALFTYAEQEFNRHLRDALVEDGFRVILPQEFEMKVHEKELFDQCLSGIERADLMLAVVDGAEVDVGVGFEMGVAYSKGKPVLALRTDFRRRAETTTGCLNLMLHYGATKMAYTSDYPFQEAAMSVRRMLQDAKNR